jgi:PBSX family phage terminase large subunit
MSVEFNPELEEISVKGFNPPSYDEILFNFLGDSLLHYDKMSSVFKDNFQKNENQLRFQHLLDTCTVPENQQLYILVWGDVGSGKTWLALQYILDNMLSTPKVRTIAIRRTSADIEQSVYRETLEFFDTYNVPYKKNDKHLLITLTNRSYIHMRSDKALVLAGKNKSDALGSQQFTYALLEEADSISEEAFNTLPARLRQKTDKRKIIFCICNPPDENHWLYKRFFVDNNPDDPASPFRALYCPQSGNQFLPEGYNESLQAFYEGNPSLQGSFLGGKFTANVKGDPIFMSSFNQAIHVAPGPLEYNKKYPICRAWDYGYRGNCCHFGQYDMDRKQIRILKTVFKEKMLLDTFAEEILSISYQCYPNMNFEDYGDPSGRSQTAHGLSYHDTLRQKGINTRWFIHEISYGLSVLENLLKTMSLRQGKELTDLNLIKPFLLIDPACTHLIKALQMGYCNKKGTPSGVLDPVKDGWYDHPVDALRYWLVMLMRHMGASGYNRPTPGNYMQPEIIPMTGSGNIYSVPPRNVKKKATYGSTIFGRSNLR